MTKVVHVLEEDYDIYIGDTKSALFRSEWYNPFKPRPEGPWSMDESLGMYEERIKDTPKLYKALPSLKGKILGCWCKSHLNPDTPCHGDVLVKLINQLENEDEWEELGKELEAVKPDEPVSTGSISDELEELRKELGITL